jgi:hypothetical protein
MSSKSDFTIDGMGKCCVNKAILGKTKIISCGNRFAINNLRIIFNRPFHFFCIVEMSKAIGKSAPLCSDVTTIESVRSIHPANTIRNDKTATLAA